MNIRLQKISRGIGVGLAVLLSAYLSTVAVLYATGRGGSAPCGEDDWRWGLMHLFVGGAMFLASTAAGAGVHLSFRGRMPLALFISLAVLLQGSAAFNTIAVLDWPHVFHHVPICE